MAPGIPSAVCGPEDRGSGLCPAHPFLDRQISDISKAVERRQTELLEAIGELRDDVTVLAQEVHEHHAYHKGQEDVAAKAVNWGQFALDILKWGVITTICALSVLVLSHAASVMGIFGGR